jgi:hypothetical protein
MTTFGAPIQNDEENRSDYTEVSAGSVERNSSSSITEVTEELPAAELCVPMDTLAALEWLSTFVEDSFMSELPPLAAGLWIRTRKIRVGLLLSAPSNSGL